MDLRRRRTTGWLLVGGALAAVFGLVGAGVAKSANQLSYDVVVTEQSTAGHLPACRPTMVIVDRKTGAELACAGTPVEGFTVAERQEILGHAAKLAADGDIDGTDGFELTQLATDIGHRHGDDANSVLPALFLGIAVVGGVTFIVGTVRKISQLRASRNHWRDWRQRLGR
ncbi:hypothetical protein EV138_3634 [Kribbella voronezhensis]|uniref:Uncharacterized protein n=1 Tax=Kribbella voronezhensis TaxID=2512212 RepID=A0A4R7TD42_9ACTN|nr:hypothetical protein [Kribbella voronezhensis]TDU90051.1 hypothetical protein EV138_3634 [Kribbella voronezhensis]